MNRRRVLQALLGSSVLKAAGPPCPVPTHTTPPLCPITISSTLPQPSRRLTQRGREPRLRKNASQITKDGGWQFYIDAYTAWFAKGASNSTPDSPAWFRFIHAYYCAPNANNIHRTWAFLPWHRAFLAYHESTIANLDKKFKDFTIPVWDWDFDQTVPKPFRAFQPWLDFAGSDNYGPHPPEIPNWPPHLLSQWLSGENWKQFMGTADQPPGAAQHCHEFVHGMDGYFANFAQCAGDPLFYMHHANVDRFWSHWQNKLENRQHPAFTIDPLFYRQTFYFPPPRFNSVVAGSQREIAQLGYVYKPPAISISPVKAQPIITTISDPSDPNVLSGKLIDALSELYSPPHNAGEVLEQLGHVSLPELRLTLLIDPVHTVQHVKVLLGGIGDIRYPVGQFVVLPHQGSMPHSGKTTVTFILNFSEIPHLPALIPNATFEPTLLLLSTGSDQATAISRSQIIEAAFLSKPLI